MLVLACAFSERGKKMNDGGIGAQQAGDQTEQTIEGRREGGNMQGKKRL